MQDRLEATATDPETRPFSAGPALAQLALSLACIGMCASVRADDLPHNKGYTVESSSGQTVELHRKVDGSFTLAFPERTPGHRHSNPQVTRERIIALPAPILAQLLARWTGEIPVQTSRPDWHRIDFTGPEGPARRQRVTMDIAEKMFWQAVPIGDATRLYLKPMTE